MAFPVSKQAHIKFELADNPLPNLASIRNAFFNHLGHAEIEKLQKQDDRIIFTSKNSLFRLSYEISIGFKLENRLIVDYEIRLSELLKVCIFVALLIAFFSRMQMGYFMLLFVVTLTSFYILNVFIVENGLKNLLRDIFEKTEFSPKNTPDGEPQTWMDDISRCPACGEFVSEFEGKCPSCKLSLPIRKTGHKYYKPYQDGSPEPTIHYEYKEKKK